MQTPANEPLDANAVNESIKRHSNKWRDKLSFWIFGLTYKFNYILILSAAHDIIKSLLPELNLVQPTRLCYELSSGVILLANVVPAHLLLFIIPKLPIVFKLHMTIACLLNVACLATIAYTNQIMLALIGVVVGSLGFGIAEYALSIQISLHKRKEYKIFNSTTNASCVYASLYYAVLREFNLSIPIIFYSLIPLQFFALVATWLVSRVSPPQRSPADLASLDSEFPLSIFNLHSSLTKFEDKCQYICHLMHYVIPLGLITKMQFFINQGLYEFIYFRVAFLNVDSQYRWLNVLFQVGLCACLTTKTLFVVRQIWFFTVLQLIFTAFLVVDAVYFITGYVWVILIIAYFEGMISGAAYTNTIYKMERQELERRMDIAESVLKQSLSLSTILGGVLAVVTHHILCRTAEPSQR